MRDPSDLLTYVESSDEHLDRACQKISRIDKLVKEGNNHFLIPGLSKSSVPDLLHTQPDVGGAQTTLSKSLMTLPASSSSTCDSSNLSAFPADSLRQFDASQEYARQVVHASRASALSFADRRTLDLLNPSQSHYQPKPASVKLLFHQDQFTEIFRNINNFQDI